jgi:casein kinase II subunit alpha
VNEKNKDMVSEEALDLLEKMLQYDKNKRIGCKAAMAHNYFNPIRDFLKE